MIECCKAVIGKCGNGHCRHWYRHDQGRVKNGGCGGWVWCIYVKAKVRCLKVTIKKGG